MKALSESEQAAVLRIVAEHKSRPGPLIEILHAVQSDLGFVPAGAVPLIAQGLNLSRAEVHGVVTFYHFFRDKPAGRHILRLCQAESCKSMGADALAEHAKQRLGIDFHETTQNGDITLEPVYCLGNCACSPALMIDEDDLRGRVTTEAFDEIVTAMGRRT
jgi:formate dehydrogenase subunit gamma